MGESFNPRQVVCSTNWTGTNCPKCWAPVLCGIVLIRWLRWLYDTLEDNTNWHKLTQTQEFDTPQVPYIEPLYSDTHLRYHLDFRVPSNLPVTWELQLTRDARPLPSDWLCERSKYLSCRAPATKSPGRKDNWFRERSKTCGAARRVSLQQVRFYVYFGKVAVDPFLLQTRSVFSLEVQLTACSGGSLVFKLFIISEISMISQGAFFSFWFAWFGYFNNFVKSFHEIILKIWIIRWNVVCGTCKLATMAPDRAPGQDSNIDVRNMTMLRLCTTFGQKFDVCLFVCLYTLQVITYVLYVLSFKYMCIYIYTHWSVFNTISLLCNIVVYYCTFQYKIGMKVST